MSTTEPRLPATTRTLLTLAWPIIVSRATQAIVGLCDALMVAHLGKAALAATTTGAMNAFTVFILPMGTVFIVGTFASQFFGKGDLAGARRYAWYGLAIAVATQVVAIGSQPFVGDAVALLPLEPDVASLMATYMRIRILSGGAVIAVEALGAYYNGLGNTRRPMAMNVLAMVLNVIGNWLLIDGHLGFPAMGVEGAAWASSIATFTAAGVFLGWFLWEGLRAGRVVPRLHLAELGRTLRFGLPSGVNWFFEFLAFMFFVNVVVGDLGTHVLAAIMAVIQLNSVSFMPAFGLASAGAVLVGQSIGAGARDEVPRTVKLTFLVAAAWQVAVGLVYLSMPVAVFSLFVEGDQTPDLLEVGVRMLMISAAWQLFDAAAAVLTEALRGAGDTAFVMWIRVAISWGLFVPGAWLSVRVMGGGDVVATVSMVTYLAVLALALTLRFRAGAWRRFDLTAETPIG